MFPAIWRLFTVSKSNSSTLFPSTTTTRVSSVWVASISIFFGILFHVTAHHPSALAPMGRQRHSNAVIGSGNTAWRYTMARALGARLICSYQLRAHHRGPFRVPDGTHCIKPAKLQDRQATCWSCDQSGHPHPAQLRLTVAGREFLRAKAKGPHVAETLAAKRGQRQWAIWGKASQREINRRQRQSGSASPAPVSADSRHLVNAASSRPTSGANPDKTPT